MRTTTKNKIKDLLFGVLNYVPGIIILIFGMLALHSSLILINEKRGLYEVIETSELGTPIPAFYRDDNHSILKQTTGSLDNIVKITELKLYWSVIALGLSGFLLLVLNADKLKKLSQAGRDRKETFKLLENRLAAMEASSDGIVILDKDGNIVYLNKAFKNIHELKEDSPEVYTRKSWDELYDTESQSIFINDILPNVYQDGHWGGEANLSCGNGVLIEIELSLTKLNDEGVIGTLRDISQRRRTQEEKDSIQKQFYQAQKMEAVGRLAGGIAHDFNNILAAINGYAEFLKDDLEVETPQYKFADNILKAGSQAKSLVDQMLAFSRIKNDNFEIFDFNAPLKESISILGASMPKSIEVTDKISSDKIPIRGNATQISQTFLNLCVNAKDAMEDEKGSLEIFTSQKVAEDFSATMASQGTLPSAEDAPVVVIEDLDPGQTRLTLGAMQKGRNYVLLGIKDSGSGMSRQVLEHVFEPFFTTKSVDKGTGLGLATVHGVIRSHMGAMVINTKIGEGTEFLLYFPVAEEEVFESKVDKKENNQEVLKGVSILLVEDQDEVAEMTTIMLERIGVSAKRCVSGLNALDELRENPDKYDVVLTDQNMPKMTGIELVHEVQYDGNDIPFILLSGYSEQKLQDLMKEHPAIKAILRKPVKQADLSQEISRVIEEKEEKKSSAA